LYYNIIINNFGIIVSGKIIIRDAWSERTSSSTDDSLSSAHRTGKIATIALSLPINKSVTLVEMKHYEYDRSMQLQLASVSHCMDFQYVRVNAGQGSVTVGVNDCFSSEISFPLCTEPSLSNGKYVGDHDGPTYQYAEHITALCNPGYWLEGSISRICIAEETWSGEDPKCVLACDDLAKHIPNCAEPVYDFEQGTVTFECQSGCVPSGMNLPLRCNPLTKNFEGTSTFKCIKDNSTCELFTAPRNGQYRFIHGIPGDVGSVAVVSCNEGFVLKGRAYLICQDDGEWDYSPPLCEGSTFVVALFVPGFEYLRATHLVNPFDSQTLKDVNFTGRMNLPYPPFNLVGSYNSSTRTIVFTKDLSLPLVQVAIGYRIDVSPQRSEIVLRQFHGHLSKPLEVAITGYFRTSSPGCQLALSSLVNESTVYSIQILFTVKFCNNCVEVCLSGVEMVSLTVWLHQPWQIYLNGYYALKSNVSEVSVAGTFDINGYLLEVHSSISAPHNLHELLIQLHIPSPIELNVTGSYSYLSETATLRGKLTISFVIFEVTVIANIANREISELILAANISVPFLAYMEGMYDFQTNKTNTLRVKGTLGNFYGLNVSVSIGVNLGTKSLDYFSFASVLAAPLQISLSGMYSSLPNETLKLMGSISLQNNSHMLGLTAAIELSPLSLMSLTLSGTFPPPLDFIELLGTYHQECSCASVAGMLMRDYFKLLVTTNLTFTEDNMSPTIKKLEMRLTLLSPIVLELTGNYDYTPMYATEVNGVLNISNTLYLRSSASVRFHKNSSVSVSEVSFQGKFTPLSLIVHGHFVHDSAVLTLNGFLNYPVAALNVSLTYVFMNGVNNISAVAGDVFLHGTLIKPFPLSIQGRFSQLSSTISLHGNVTVNEYLMLRVNVLFDAAQNPPQLTQLSFSGSITTPLSFAGEFRGVYNSTSSKAVLTSHLRIGSSMFNATGLLVYTGNEKFSLQSIEVSGIAPPPLAFSCQGVYYVLGNSSEVFLMGHIMIRPFTFMSKLHAIASSVTGRIIVKSVEVSAEINDPAGLQLKGTYRSGDVLLVKGTLNLTELYLSATASINVTADILEITSLVFEGHLLWPFSGIVTGTYGISTSSLNLTGSIELANLMFTLRVSMNTSPLQVKSMHFTTIVKIAGNSVDLMATYDSSSTMLHMNGHLTFPQVNINIKVSSSIDLQQNTRKLGQVVLCMSLLSPAVDFIGVYNSSSNTVYMRGSVKLSNLVLAASVRVTFGPSTPLLGDVTYSITYIIPFGSRPSLHFEGMYNSSKKLLFLTARIQSGQSVASSAEEHSRGLLILSTVSPHLRVAALMIPEANIPEILKKYVNGLNWPSKFVQLKLKNIMVYKSWSSVTYRGFDYQQGYHASMEMKIFLLPRIIVSASLIIKPEKIFRGSLTLADSIDLYVVAICGSNDPQCTTGPTVAIDIRPQKKEFSIKGDIRLFSVRLGNVAINIGRKSMVAKLTLSQDIVDSFSGLIPGMYTLYWNEDGFYTSLHLPDLNLPDFSFTNVTTVDICRKLGCKIAKFAIDSNFNLDTKFTVTRKEGSIVLSIIVFGTVDLDIVGQPALTLDIKPVPFQVTLSGPLNWRNFIHIIHMTLTKNAGILLDGILGNVRALALFASGKLGQRLVKESAAELCEGLVRDAAAAAVAATAAAAAGEAVAATGAASLIGTITLLFVNFFSINDSSGRNELMEFKQNFMLTCEHSNGGCEQHCQMSDGMAVCSCGAGSTLGADGRSCVVFDRCQTSANMCDTNATCMESGFADTSPIICTCNAGLTGNGMTCRDINECTSPGICSDTSVCVNSDGSYYCECLSGYRNVMMDGECKDIDECLDSGIQCGNHSQCVNTPGSYNCVCDVGFYRNGSQSLCYDIDECANKSVCLNGVCSNTVGSYGCLCNDGYLKNGSMCIDVNECTDEDLCSPFADCTNFDGSFNCSCIPGYAGNGSHCEDVDECTFTGTCNVRAICNNTDGSYSCACMNGYLGNGSVCEDIDECSLGMSNCVEVATCKNTDGGYTCVCMPGYMGNATVCQDINECEISSNLCGPHANCSNVIGSYKCDCYLGYTSNGTHCNDVNECSLSPCHGIANCANTEGSYTCTCPNGFTGNALACSGKWYFENINLLS
jgi:hypothetical protein